MTVSCYLLKTFQEVPFPAEAVISLGSFDGVHLAHRALFARANEIRNKKFPNAATAVFCFSALPVDHLSKTPTKHLSTLAEKLALFAECGIDYAFVGDFPSLCEYSPARFVTEILQNTCHAVFAVCGFNHRFGKGGTGHAEELCALMNGNTEIFPPFSINGEQISSSLIRGLLQKGDAEKAAKLLSRPYSFVSKVIKGKGLGRQWGFPTINQMIPEKKIIPLSGVYLSICRIDGIDYPSLSNIGTHPTVDTDAPLNCETYLLSFVGDLYGKEAKISFLQLLRPEIKFSSPEKLQRQIAEDIALAEKLHRLS